MSGDIVNLFEKQRFSFGNVESGGNLEYILAKAVDITDYPNVTLVVRVHDKTVPSGSTVEVFVKTAAPTPEDPSVNFVTTSSVASVTVSDTSGDAGDALVDQVAADVGGFLQVLVKGTHGGAPPSTFYAELSADLVLRTSRGGGADDWASVLAKGADSGGTDPNITHGDTLKWDKSDGPGWEASVRDESGNDVLSFRNAAGAEQLVLEPGFDDAVRVGTGNLVVGDFAQTTHSDIYLRYSSTARGLINFMRGGSPVWSWSSHSGWADDFRIYRYRYGSYQDYTEIDNATGNWRFPQDIKLLDGNRLVGQVGTPSATIHVEGAAGLHAGGDPGAVHVAGGLSGAASAATGGAASLSGGGGGATGIGGAVTVRGGAGGTTSGDGGAITVEGGTPTSGDGGAVAINGADAVGSGDGGTVSLSSGDGVGGSGAAGIIALTAGDSASAKGGDVAFAAGDGATGGDLAGAAGRGSGTGVGGAVLLSGGTGGSTSGTGGQCAFSGGGGRGSGSGGAAVLVGGTGGSSSGTGGACSIVGGTGGPGGTGGAAVLSAGAAGSGNAQGGTASVSAGGGSGSGDGGDLNLSAGSGGSTGDGGQTTISGGTSGDSNQGASLNLFGGTGLGGLAQLSGGGGGSGNPGGSVTMSGGDGGTGNSSGGNATVAGGGRSGSGIPGNVLLEAAHDGDGDGGFVAISTTGNNYVTSDWRHATAGFQTTGTSYQTIFEIKGLSTNGRNLKVRAWITGQGATSHGNVTSVRVEQVFYRVGGSTVSLIPDHLSKTRDGSSYDALVVVDSPDTTRILIQVAGEGAAVNWIAQISWQFGGMGA